MACGCGKKRVYIVTTAAGNTKTVDSLNAALTMVRKEGGRYQLAKA